MKQLFLLAFLLFSFEILATDCIPNCECDTDWTLEVRGAYYHPTARQLRKVYSSSFIDYQVEAAKRIHDFIEIWGSVDWASKRGNKHTHQRGNRFTEETRINIIPASLGLKAIYPIFPFVDVYAGAGLSYAILQIKNHHTEYDSYSDIVDHPPKRIFHKYAFGGLFKLGFQFAMSDSTFLDFFADYTVLKFHFSHRDNLSSGRFFKNSLDCSGYKIGAGFGVYF